MVLQATTGGHLSDSHPTTIGVILLGGIVGTDHPGDGTTAGTILGTQAGGGHLGITQAGTDHLGDGADLDGIMIGMDLLMVGEADTIGVVTMDAIRHIIPMVEDVGHSVMATMVLQGLDVQASTIMG